ncbi:MAG: amino acid ABC transporter permease [Oscillospiraceae bacterium]|nr:amino acid ABC transporter permease [Oscillospiraceae bacterium]
MLPTTFFGWLGYLWAEYWPLFLQGSWTALVIAVVGTVMGFVLGLLVAIVRTMPKDEGASLPRRIALWLLRFLCGAYVQVFRGTPMIVQAMVIFYGLIQYAHIQLPLLAASIVIMGVNTGAYMAETVRSGIISIDKGQTEAAMSIGMTHWQTMRCIVLPQAIRNVLPTVCNTLVANIKDSSLLNVIAVSELYFVAKSAAGTYFKYFEVYTIVAVIYFILTTVISELLLRWEKKLDGPKDFQLVDEEVL